MQKILFIYNAQSATIHLLKDSIHKIFSPATYPCNLCLITYGSFKLNAEWKNFLFSTSLRLEFLHKDEFLVRYPNVKSSFPVAFKVDNENQLVELITTQKMQEISLNELIIFLKTLETEQD